MQPCVRIHRLVKTLRVLLISWLVAYFVRLFVFLPLRRYASAGNSDRNLSVCPSVRRSVRHAPALCQNEES